jgi:ABC-type phosphate transport system ATPase subunit
MPIDVLSVESLNFYYNSTEVLSGISLVIHQEITSVW